MSECQNAEIRDRLPDLVHDRLDAHTRAAVVAHVEGCASCRAELKVLRDVRAMFDAGTPRVDVARIVGALPAPARRRRWMDWRIAAGIAVLVAGGGSIAVLNHESPRMLPGDSVAVAPPTVSKAPRANTIPNAQPVLIADSQHANSGARAGVSPATDDAARGGLAMTGRLGDLSEAQLEALLKQIDQLEAVPVTEPEPVVLPVSTTRPASSRGGDL